MNTRDFQSTIYQNSAEFIRKNTQDSGTVVDFGAGNCVRLKLVPADAIKIAIEAFGKYLQEGICKFSGQLETIEENFLMYRDFFYESDMEFATGMLIDSIEHVLFRDGAKLLVTMQEYFEKIIVFTPHGPKEDAVGHEENPYQKHKSYWLPEDFERLGFQEVSVNPNYHGNGIGAIFAVWRRDAS